MAESASGLEGFRWVLAAAKQPETGHRLLLIPSSRIRGSMILPPPPFDKLLEEFRNGQVAFADQPTWIFVRPVGAECQHDDFDDLGHIRLWANEPGKSHTFWLATLKEQSKREWRTSLLRLTIEAGSHLPIGVKDHLDWCVPSTPFAWWIATMWAFGSAEPRAFSTGIGSVLMHPFENSVRAIERCPLLQAKPAEIGDGIWSAPMSLGEIAYRVTGKKKAKARDLPADFRKQHQMRQHSKNKWCVRIDEMVDELRSKFVDSANLDNTDKDGQ